MQNGIEGPLPRSSQQITQSNVNPQLQDLGERSAPITGVIVIDRVAVTRVPTARPSLSPARPDQSRRHCRQLDDRTIARRRNRLQARAATALNRPFVVLFKQQRADEPRDCILFGKDFPR